MHYQYVHTQYMLEAADKAGGDLKKYAEIGK